MASDLFQPNEAVSSQYLLRLSYGRRKPNDKVYWENLEHHCLYFCITSPANACVLLGGLWRAGKTLCSLQRGTTSPATGGIRFRSQPTASLVDLKINRRATHHPPRSDFIGSYPITSKQSIQRCCTSRSRLLYPIVAIDYYYGKQALEPSHNSKYAVSKKTILESILLGAATCDPIIPPTVK